MASPKRQYAAIERELIRTLTAACETAKSEIVGFQWLTHEVDYAHFPKSLVVTWVFDSELNKSRALAGADKPRMHALTLAAFEELGISVTNIAEHLAFGSEQGQGDHRPSTDKVSSRRGQGH